MISRYFLSLSLKCYLFGSFTISKLYLSSSIRSVLMVQESKIKIYGPLYTRHLQVSSPSLPPRDQGLPNKPYQLIDIRNMLFLLKSLVIGVLLPRLHRVLDIKKDSSSYCQTKRNLNCIATKSLLQSLIDRWIIILNIRMSLIFFFLIFATEFSRT